MTKIFFRLKVYGREGVMDVRRLFTAEKMARIMGLCGS